MFEFIKGEIVEKKTTHLVIENNEIAYNIHISLTTYDKITAKGNQTKIFLHLDVKENDLTLYGFYSKLERRVFRSLIKVSGVGPKIAISILSGISISNLVNAIADRDVELLKTVPGIGKKSAQRLIVELKESFETISVKIEKKFKVSEEERNIIKDAQEALISLGYNRTAVQKEIQHFMKNHDIKSSEEIVKTVIKKFYNKK